jgi:hypothetical protein
MNPYTVNISSETAQGVKTPVFYRSTPPKQDDAKSETERASSPPFNYENQKPLSTLGH